MKTRVIVEAAWDPETKIAGWACWINEKEYSSYIFDVENEAEAWWSATAIGIIISFNQKVQIQARSLFVQKFVQSTSIRKSFLGDKKVSLRFKHVEPNHLARFRRHHWCKQEAERQCYEIRN